MSVDNKTSNEILSYLYGETPEEVIRERVHDLRLWLMSTEKNKQPPSWYSTSMQPLHQMTHMAACNTDGADVLVLVLDALLEAEPQLTYVKAGSQSSHYLPLRVAILASLGVTEASVY